MNKEIDWDKLNKIAATILLLVPLTIVCSFIYNLGYFYCLDISLSQVPLNWNDYILTSVNWFLIILTLLFMGILIECQFKRIEGYRKEDELTQGSKKTKNIRSFITNYLLPVMLIADFFWRERRHFCFIPERLLCLCLW